MTRRKPADATQASPEENSQEVVLTDVHGGPDHDPGPVSQDDPALTLLTPLTLDTKTIQPPRGSPHRPNPDASHAVTRATLTYVNTTINPKHYYVIANTNTFTVNGSLFSSTSNPPTLDAYYSSVSNPRLQRRPYRRRQSRLRRLDDDESGSSAAGPRQHRLSDRQLRKHHRRRGLDQQRQHAFSQLLQRHVHPPAHQWTSGGPANRRNIKPYLRKLCLWPSLLACARAEGRWLILQ